MLKIQNRQQIKRENRRRFICNMIVFIIVFFILYDTLGLILDTPVVTFNYYTNECVSIDDPHYSCDDLPKTYFKVLRRNK